jgi:hypothetical protein
MQIVNYSMLDLQPPRRVRSSRQLPLVVRTSVSYHYHQTPFGCSLSADCDPPLTTYGYCAGLGLRRWSGVIRYIVVAYEPALPLTAAWDTSSYIRKMYDPTQLLIRLPLTIRHGGGRARRQGLKKDPYGNAILIRNLDNR